MKSAASLKGFAADLEGALRYRTPIRYLTKDKQGYNSATYVPAREVPWQVIFS